MKSSNCMFLGPCNFKFTHHFISIFLRYVCAQMRLELETCRDLLGPTRANAIHLQQCRVLSSEFLREPAQLMKKVHLRPVYREQCVLGTRLFPVESCFDSLKFPITWFRKHAGTLQLPILLQLSMAIVPFS